MQAQNGRGSRRDYEEFPEAPDLGASVQLENEEHLAAPAGDRDALDAGYVPPDRPYALDEDGVTPREAREGEAHEGRLQREQDDDPDAYTDADRSGRLEAADGGAALETDDAMDAVDVGLAGGAASAEEAAMHTTAEPMESDAVRDEAERIDESPETAGSAAPAAGRRDAGENVGADGIDDVRQ